MCCHPFRWQDSLNIKMFPKNQSMSYFLHRDTHHGKETSEMTNSSKYDQACQAKHVKLLSLLRPAKIV